MKKIKIYEEFITPEKNISAYRDYLTGVKDKNKDIVGFRWDIDNDQVKIFLDITNYSHKTQTFFGKGIIGWAAFKDWGNKRFKGLESLRWEKVNHIGFIFKDGTVLHATNSGKGVQFETYDDVINNPECYLVYNMKGNEKSIRDLGIKLVKKISENVPEEKCEDCMGKGKIIFGPRSGETCETCDGNGEFATRYDFKGIARQILPEWMENIFAAEKTDYKFFCSELVANLLVRSKLMTYDYLKGLHESLDKYDEIDPTKLYKFIIERGDPANLVVKYKSGKEEVIKPSDFIN